MTSIDIRHKFKGFGCPKLPPVQANPSSPGPAGPDSTPPDSASYADKLSLIGQFDKETELKAKELVREQQQYGQIPVGPMKVREETDLALVDREVKKVLALPVDERDEALKNLYVVTKSVATEVGEMREIITRGLSLVLEENRELHDSVKAMQAKLDLVADESAIVKAAREKREARAEKEANRVPREEGEPLLLEHYETLLEFLGTEMTFSLARLRLTIAVMFVTGMRIGELAPVRLEDIKSLFNKQRPCVKFQASKGGPVRTAHLTAQGKKVVKARQEDFLKVLKYQKENLETVVFGHERTHKQVTREHITKTVNNLLSRLDPLYQAKFTTHSFRKGYINFLWQESKDIEWIRQVIGHASVESTIIYIKTLSQRDQATRMAEIGEKP